MYEGIMIRTKQPQLAEHVQQVMIYRIYTTVTTFFLGIIFLGTQIMLYSEPRYAYNTNSFLVLIILALSPSSHIATNFFATTEHSAEEAGTGYKS